jgi:hypothetical protein
MKELKRAYYIARKDLKAYYFKPPLVSWGLMLPFVFILSAGYRRSQPGLGGLNVALFYHLHGGDRHQL